MENNPPLFKKLDFLYSHLSKRISNAILPFRVKKANMHEGTSLLIFTIVSFLLGFLPAMAGRTISGIKVEISAASGVQAREEAIVEAKRQGFLKIIGEDSENFKATSSLPNEEELENLVEAVEIEKEKISTNRYNATFSVTFDEKALQSFLTNSPQGGKTSAQDDSPFTSSFPLSGSLSLSKDVVLIPAYSSFEEPLLWEPLNPLRAFLRNLPSKNGLSFVVPLGDLEDIMSVSIEDIMADKHQKVRGLIERYKKTLAVVMVMREVSSNQSTYEISFKVFDKEKLVLTTPSEVIEGQNLEECLTQAYDALSQALEPSQISHRRAFEKTFPFNTYPGIAFFDSFKTWQVLKKALQNDPSQAIEITELSRTQARLSIRTSLPLENLIQKLREQGISATITAENILELQLFPQETQTQESFLTDTQESSLDSGGPLY